MRRKDNYIFYIGNIIRGKKLNHSSYPIGKSDATDLKIGRTRFLKTMRPIFLWFVGIVSSGFG
jgi:hypothetical protein